MKKINVLTNFFLTIELLFFFNLTNAQNSASPDYDKSAAFFLSNPVEKLYLHTDRDMYAENDTIWFKAYLVNAHTLKLDNGPLRNIYVELVDSEKKILARNMLATMNGISFGDFVVDNYKLKRGKYKLRAYTRYQTNFGEDLLFEKNLLITSAFDEQKYEAYFDSIAAAESSVESDFSEIDLQFMPEGGYLTNGIVNNLAFKAVDKRGYGVDFNGVIYDDSDAKVVEFKSEHLGMGRIQFKPELGKRYYAVTDKNSNRFSLPEATDLLLMTTAVNNDSLLVIRLKSNVLQVTPAYFHVVVTARGLVNYYAKVLVNAPLKTVKIPFSELAMGINQITLLNADFVPIRERLVFIDKKEVVNVQITTDRETYKKRDSVTVEVKAANIDGTPAKTYLSVAVVDKNLSKTLEPENIYSYMLLDSEIKGNIEKPSYYFDSNNENAKQHLDLLLATQGWSCYLWENLIEDNPKIKFQKQYGIEVNGMVSRVFASSGIKNGEVAMTIMQGGDVVYQTATTDSLGRFSMPNLVIPDNTEALFTCRTKIGSRMNEILPVQTFSPEYPVTKFGDFKIPSKEGMEEFGRIAHQRYLEDKAYNPDKYEILLDEVVVKKKIDATEVKDDHFRPYTKADYSYTVTEEEESFVNVLFYISRKMGSVKYDGESLYISGMGAAGSGNTGSPLLFLDGIEVDQFEMENLPMASVDKVEVLKEPTSTIMFQGQGSYGGNGTFGVIAVYTKKGSKSATTAQNGQLRQTLRGYYSSRKFYSPRYNVDDKKKSGRDSRVTLLWAPIINTDEEGVARFTFFNADNSSTIKIVAEGVSADGKFAVSEKTYKVE